MEFFKSSSRRYRRRIAYLLRLFLNVIHYVTESYLINKLNVDSVANDLGASFTAIQRKRGRLVKRADAAGEAKLRDEIEWILRFRDTELARYLPQIYNFSLEPGNVFYEMRYYDFPNLRRIILSEMNARFFVRLRLLHLLETLDGELWTEANGIATPAGFVADEYFVKFAARRRAAVAIEPYFERIYASPSVVLNGKTYVNAAPLLAAIQADPAAFASLTPPKLYISHGDIHTNNIMCGISHVNMILIDCRGKSSAGIPYFDPAYDLAKIFHDFRGGYSLIERHNYSIFHRLDDATGTPTVDYRFLDERGRSNFRDYYAFIRAVAHRRLTRFGNILQRADFAESLLFLTMIPMHMKQRDEALMCYSVGVKELNDWCSRQFPDLYAAVRRSVGIEGGL
jgi:hypothetical protein